MWKSYFFKIITEYLIKNGVDRENILLIDLELPQYSHIKTREELDEIVLEFLENHENKTYLFFDEIQNVYEWEISINGYYKLSNSDIFILDQTPNYYQKNLQPY